MMDAPGWTAVGNNLVGMLVGVVTIWVMVVRPYANELRKFRDARITERLDEHDRKLREQTIALHDLRSDMDNKFDATFKYDHTERVGMHRRMDKQDAALARLDERTTSTNETVKSIAGDLKEVAAAVANLAGRQGVG
jgi:hypothetical protein